MSLYNNANELLQAAMKQGLINVVQPRLLLGSVEVQLPNNVINVLNIKKWVDFLNHVITTSDSDEEIKFASHILESCQEQTDQTKQTADIDDRKTISTDDVISIAKDIDSCNSVDDIFKLMNITDKVTQKLVIPAEPTINVLSEKLPNAVHWRRPINVNGKCRYYAHDISWYIERQITCNESGGLVYFYSLFTHESKEVARFDKLKDAKSNFLNTVKRLNM